MKKAVTKTKEDLLSKLFESMRRVDTATDETTRTIEKHFTSGPLGERTILHNGEEVAALVFLKFAGEVYGIPELLKEAELWETELISNDGGKGREQMVNIIQAKIQRELELAEIRARESALLRERR